MEIINVANTYLINERDILRYCVVKNINHVKYPVHSIQQIGITNQTYYDLWHSNKRIGQVNVINYITKRVIIYTWDVKGNLEHEVELYFEEKFNGD